MERREAQMCCLASFAKEAHRLTALHRGDFGQGERSSGTGRALSRPDPAAFAAFVLSASSHSRQSHVVGPVADPSLPDATGANRARRRRILLRFKAPSRSAPHEQDMPNIREVQSAGIGMPITKCCGGLFRISPRRPGEGRDPYSLRHQFEGGMERSSHRHHYVRWLWVPAFAGTTEYAAAIAYRNGNDAASS